MTRLHSDFDEGTLSSSINSSVTSIASAGFATLPVVSGGNTLAIVLDPAGDAGAPETVIVTAHTASATTVTVTRGAEGTTARSHAAGARWAHNITAADFAAASISFALYGDNDATNVQDAIAQVIDRSPAKQIIVFGDEGDLEVGTGTVRYPVYADGVLSPDAVVMAGNAPPFTAAEIDIRYHGPGTNDAGDSIFSAPVEIAVGSHEEIQATTGAAVTARGYLTVDTIADGGSSAIGVRAGSYATFGDASSTVVVFNGTNSGSDGFAMPLPADYEDSDLLCCVVLFGGTTTLGTLLIPAGWTLLDATDPPLASAGTNMQAVVLWKEASGTEAGGRIGTTSTDDRPVLAVAFAVAGAVADASGFDVVPSNILTTTSSLATAATPTPATTPDALVSVFGLRYDAADAPANLSTAPADAVSSSQIKTNRGAGSVDHSLHVFYDGLVDTDDDTARTAAQTATHSNSINFGLAVSTGVEGSKAGAVSIMLAVL